jgi:hypothetical protein
LSATASTVFHRVEIPANGARLDTTTGTPDLSGSNTRRLHTCRMDPAFHADAASCVGGSVRVRPSQRAGMFLLAVQSGFFYSGFTAVTEPVKAPDESRLACAWRGAAVSDRIDLTQIEPAEKL